MALEPYPIYLGNTQKCKSLLKFAVRVAWLRLRVAPSAIRAEKTIGAYRYLICA